jgi:hypothetical protein
VLDVHETLGWAHHMARERGLTLPLLVCFTGLIAAIDRAPRAA